MKALQSIVGQHFQDSPSLRPTKNVLDTIVTCSRGDIRGAVMELQLSCLVGKAPSRKGKKGGSSNSIAFLKLTSQREQSLALFHLIGKVMYNKRVSHFLFGTSMLKYVFSGKGDPPSSSTTKREKEQLRLLEQSIPDPEKLPSHLEFHDRKASLVDVNVCGLRIISTTYARLMALGRCSMQTRRLIHLCFPYTCTRTTLSSVMSSNSAVTLRSG